MKIFVFAAAEQTPDNFLGGFVASALADSVEDIKNAISDARGIANTKKKADAAIVVQVVSREEINGEYVVHVHVTLVDGREANLTGTSGHQWKQSAKRIVKELVSWVKANRSTALGHAARVRIDLRRTCDVSES